MHITTSVPIKAPKKDIWRVITDIENAPKVISAIQDVEVLNKPPAGIVGLRWKETRNLFGKTASETMWITDAMDDDYYRTEARSHGSVYRSKIYLSDQGGVTQLAMDFDAEPQTSAAKLLAATLGFLFKGATRKAMHQDLLDVKTAVETRQGGR